jgi:hypothetical protein
MQTEVALAYNSLIYATPYPQKFSQLIEFYIFILISRIAYFVFINPKNKKYLYKKTFRLISKGFFKC